MAPKLEFPAIVCICPATGGDGNSLDKRVTIVNLQKLPAIGGKGNSLNKRVTIGNLQKLPATGGKGNSLNKRVAIGNFQMREATKTLCDLTIAPRARVIKKKPAAKKVARKRKLKAGMGVAASSSNAAPDEPAAGCTGTDTEPDEAIEPDEPAVGGVEDTCEPNPGGEPAVGGFEPEPRHSSQ